MFMRYTHYGIGHPTVIRELARDCADAELVDNPGSEDIEDDEEWENDIRPHHSVGGDEGEREGDVSGDDEEQEYDDDDESSAEDDEVMGIGEDMDEEADEDDEDDYMMSF
jgi:hypothetical protein